VAMHYNHECAKVGVRSTVSSARIVDDMPAIIKVRYGCSTRLVCPAAIAPLAIPVKVPARRNHQCYEMTLLGTFVVCGGTIDKAVGFRSRSD